MPDSTRVPAPQLAVIGVPTSAGAHHAGQDLAPAALRERGLVQRLVATGLDVTDAGDVAGEVWTPDEPEVVVRNLDAVVRVARAVADAVEEQATARRIPLVLGGDCTITPGVVAGLQRVHPGVRLVYLDGDADLSSPERTTSGVLDASGVAHLLGIADNALARIGEGFPLLDEDRITLLGYDPSDHDSFDAEAVADRPRLVHASDADVRADPAGCAARALAAVAGHPFVLHFDVDAVDSRELALANFPHYGTGLPLDTARQVLQALCSAEGLVAVVLTEVNPTHDPTGGLLERYLDTVVAAMSRLAGRAG